MLRLSHLAHFGFFPCGTRSLYVNTVHSVPRPENPNRTQMRKPCVNRRRGEARQRGFTLVELLVVMLVMTTLSLLLANFIITWLQASTLAQKRADLLTNAEMALDTVMNDVRLSGSADQNNRWADANGPGGQFGWASGSHVLVLAKAAVDSSNTIIFSDPQNYISQKDNEIYYLSGTTLYRRTLESDSVNDAAVTTCPPASATSSCPADRVVATGVSNFTLTYYDADDTVVTPADARSVRVAITLEARQNSKVISASYDTRMVFRNE